MPCETCKKKSKKNRIKKNDAHTEEHHISPKKSWANEIACQCTYNQCVMNDSFTTSPE